MAGRINLAEENLGNGLTAWFQVESAIGTSFASLSPFTEVLSNRQFGTVLMVSPVDGSIEVTSARRARANLDQPPASSRRSTTA